MAKKTPEERGYISVEDACAALRQLADDVESANKGKNRLAKLSINIWYEVKVDPDAFTQYET